MKEGNNVGLGEKEKLAFCLGYIWLLKILKL